jgi:hypothetical protein
MKKALLPAGWVKPRGYANGVAASGTQVFIAGQIRSSIPMTSRSSPSRR